MINDLKIKSADIFITEQCNLKCDYCFHANKDSTLSLETGREILRKLYELNSDEFYLNFFGGEPLLYPETIFGLIDFALSLWKPERLQFAMSTNGTIFSEEIFTKLLKNKVKVQVSCDGNKDTNDKHRSGSDLVIANIPKILKFYPQLSVRMTYLPDAVGSLTANVEFLYNLGVRRIMHQAVIEADWKDKDIETYARQLTQIYNFRKFHPDLYVEFIDKPLKICANDQLPEIDFCHAGKDYIAVLPDGDVYPCHRAASKRAFKLGNILNGKRIIRGMFLNIDKNYTHCTENCRAYPVCHSCIMTHYFVNNNLLVPVQNYCRLMLVEMDLAQKYLPIEKETGLNRRLACIENSLRTIGNVVLDLSEGNQETKKAMITIIDELRKVANAKV